MEKKCIFPLASRARTHWQGSVWEPWGCVWAFRVSCFGKQFSADGVLTRGVNRSREKAVEFVGRVEEGWRGKRKLNQRELLRFSFPPAAFQAPVVTNGEMPWVSPPSVLKAVVCRVPDRRGCVGSRSKAIKSKHRWRNRGGSIAGPPVQQAPGQELLHASAIRAANQTKYSVVGASN